MLTITVDGLDTTLQQIRRRAQTLQPRLAQTLAQTLAEGAAWGRTHRLSGPHPAVLQARTGRLRRTFRSAVTVHGTTIVGRLGFLAPERPSWVGIHEYGGIIRPRRARWLTIPLGDTRGRARDYPDTFVRGRILYERTASGIVPRFLLARQVTIPARPVLRPTWERIEPLLLHRLAAALHRLSFDVLA